ncbi:ATP-binding protein [Pseudoduganella sp. GCM10020061]|uniref:ATP-binding protein n=1 Tax=Pseudoduganella sp. GCM10020061 TaxID=3317345 RepID=UPI0036336005
MRLADFILSQTESILEEWEEFARTMQPAAASMTTKALRNHASQMLKSIAHDLRTTQSLSEEIAKSHGLGPWTTQTEAGEQHGLARLESRFTIEQLASEYRALRSSVLRLWNEAKGIPSATDMGDIIRFNESVDQLLAASVFSFAKATREAGEAEKNRKDQFLAMLAHELRNPLSPISAAATLLKMAKSNDTVVTNASNIIARQVTHMATLVEDLLDVSRVTRGAIELKVEPLDLRQVIADAVEQVTPQIEARHHALAVAEFPEAISLLGDKKRLVQIITNLLTNSAKYTPEHGHIELSLEHCEDQVAIAVEDDGVGMAPDFVPHVFDLFAQAECTPDRASGGLGLGLALVKSLVDLHGGRVLCSSPGLGKGSRFTVWLPKQPVDESQVERRRTPRMNLSPARALRIMVVDDNVDAVEMLATLLQAAGHEVVTAIRGCEALERSREAAPDVFILDIGLPDMDGNELARKLRGQPETHDAVLIALTGYGLGADRDQTKAAGFDHHLVKPVNADVLCRLLGQVTP